MKNLLYLLERNKQWAADITKDQPDFFTDLAKEQKPNYLWIGCSDSRVPASRVMNLPPGELFVHRNIANLVIHTDSNSLSVLQYAVESLRVEHIIVCGHYGCGGIAAAMGGETNGVIDRWLQHIRDVAHRHAAEIDTLPDETSRLNRLGELNVLTQMANIARTTIVQNYWQSGHNLTIHGLIYHLENGRLTDLGISVAGPDAMEVLNQQM